MIEYLVVDVHLLDNAQVRMQIAGQDEFVAGIVHLEDDLFESLGELEHRRDFKSYGTRLFEAVFPQGSAQEFGLRQALNKARREEKKLRFRLGIDAGADRRLNALHWELMRDGRELELARSPAIAFSRYRTDARTFSSPIEDSCVVAKLRMLCVIAAPNDLHRKFGMSPIDYNLVSEELKTYFWEFGDSLEIDFLHRPVTPDRLQRKLEEGAFNILHFHGHGKQSSAGEGSLLFEKEDHSTAVLKASDFYELLLGLRDLKLVTLVACEGDARPDAGEEEGSFTLAEFLFKRGIPAIVAMRRSISMDVGRKFTRSFYRRLALEPNVDLAMNLARQELFISGGGYSSRDWSSPVLYMASHDGRLFDSTARKRPARDKQDQSRAPYLMVPVFVVALVGLLTLISFVPWVFQNLDFSSIPIPGSTETQSPMSGTTGGHTNPATSLHPFTALAFLIGLVCFLLEASQRSDQPFSIPALLGAIVRAKLPAATVMIPIVLSSVLSWHLWAKEQGAIEVNFSNLLFSIFLSLLGPHFLNGFIFGVRSFGSDKRVAIGTGRIMELWWITFDSASRQNATFRTYGVRL